MWRGRSTRDRPAVRTPPSPMDRVLVKCYKELGDFGEIRANSQVEFHTVKCYNSINDAHVYLCERHLEDVTL